MLYCFFNLLKSAAWVPGLHERYMILFGLISSNNSHVFFFNPSLEGSTIITSGFILVLLTNLKTSSLKKKTLLILLIFLFSRAFIWEYLFHSTP